MPTFDDLPRARRHARTCADVYQKTISVERTNDNLFETIEGESPFAVYVAMPGPQRERAFFQKRERTK